MLNEFNRDPDFVNEIGTKWWIDSSTTGYANKPNSKGVTLEGTVYMVEASDGFKTRVLVSTGGEIIEEDQSLEGLAVKIDLRKFLKGHS